MLNFGQEVSHSFVQKIQSVDSVPTCTLQFIFLKTQFAGFQLFGAGHGGCGIQRILILNTSEEFSHHLIYHTANNKQHRRDIKVQQRQVKVDDLYRDLRKVRDKIIQVRQK